MKYNLTEPQHELLWSQNYHFTLVEDGSIQTLRLTDWNLLYHESNIKVDPSYWGTLEGEEKHINWFLLQL